MTDKDTTGHETAPLKEADAHAAKAVEAARRLNGDGRVPWVVPSEGAVARVAAHRPGKDVETEDDPRALFALALEELSAAIRKIDPAAMPDDRAEAISLMRQGLELVTQGAAYLDSASKRNRSFLAEYNEPAHR